MSSGGWVGGGGGGRNRHTEIERAGPTSHHLTWRKRARTTLQTDGRALFRGTPSKRKTKPEDFDAIRLRDIYAESEVDALQRRTVRY